MNCAITTLSIMLYPVILRFGPITFSSYGLFLALSMISGVFLFWRRARSEGFDEERILDLSLVSLVSGIVGARFVFVLFNFSVFSSDLSNIVRSFNTGLSWFGGLIFGALAFVLFSRRRGWSFYKLFDLVAPALAFSQAVGGVGWILSGLAFSTAEEETALYFLIFLILSLLGHREGSRLGTSLKLRSGFLGFLWLFLSGSARFIAEFYRVESLGRIFNVNQILSGLMMIGGAAVLALRFGPEFREILGWVEKEAPRVKDKGIEKISALRGLKWLRREEAEIEKEKRILRLGNLFFRRGRTEENAEVGDEAQELLSYEYAQAMSDFLDRFGAQIRRAMRRIRGGKYGICEHCGKGINPERLKAYPAATLCLECEKKREGSPRSSDL